MANNIATQVKNCLLDTDLPLWFPNLTCNLAESAWKKIGSELQLTRDSYSTARLLTRDPEGPRQIVSYITVPSSDESRNAIAVELLPQGLAHENADSNLRFFSAEEILEGGLINLAEAALGILGSVPTLLATVCALVRSLHLLDSGDDEVDVSFSEPDLPFSVFVSVPRPGADAAELRVVEGLIHEAMHLQLTLIESFVRLVKSGEQTYFSPWKNEFRSPQGVLHALYVFRVIDEFLGSISRDSAHYSTLLDYIQKRREEIGHQVQAIDGFCECPELTSDGVQFVGRLLD